MARPRKEKPNRKDGLYEIKVTVGKNFDGSLIRKSFYSPISKNDAKRQAEKYIIEMEVAARTGETFITKDMAFGEWATKWLETYKRPDVDENTYKITYQYIVNDYLIPYFGKADLKDIKPIDIKNFYGKHSHLSESLLKKCKMCLNAIFNTAIDNDLCIKNPSKMVGFVSTRTPNVKKVYTDEEINFVFNYFLDVMPEVSLLLKTGLRRGELLGLTWKDIDFNEKTISINRSIADKQGGGTKVNPPKKGSYRINPLSKKAIAVLTSIPRSDKYIFPNGNGEATSPNTWSQRLQRHMKQMHEEYADIPILSAHELRHTYGTYLRRQGVDIYTIQKIMGHKDINMTTEIYVHNEIDVLKQAINKLDENE